MHIPKCLRSGVVYLLAILRLTAAEYHGQVKFGGLPVSGASVTASQGDKKITVISDLEGAFSLTDLSESAMTITVEMTGFSAITREVKVPSEIPAVWELRMLALNEIQAQPQKLTTIPPLTQPAQTTTDSKPAKPAAPVSDVFTELSSEELARRATDGLLINGTANNAAASPFSQSAAFGNARRNGAPLYNGNLGMILGNSALDARPFSLTGQNTPRPDYNRVTGVASFGGPLKIPHLLRNGPNLIVNYQWTRNRNASTQSALVPTLTERAGDFSQSPNQIFDPTNGQPFPGNTIPANRISPQAKALLGLYPLPNFENSSRYNYQIPIQGITHQDALQSRFNQPLPHKNQLYGNFAYLSTRTDNPNVFGLLDKLNTSGINSGINWLHTFTPRLHTIVGVQFSRFIARADPFFAHRTNISGVAGINGNNQDPENWGPPSLSFSSGIAGLSDVQSSVSRNQTTALLLQTLFNRSNHHFTFGGDFHKQQFNLLSQEDPRGSFGFTGAAVGSDLAGFLLGVPDTSSIAYGNADKYFRATSADAYVADDWRVRSGFTLNFGLRWEYGSPVTELYGRLVNLDIAPGFGAATPVVGSLLHPDRNNLAPRIGFAWRPLAASSMVVRGGYGIYYDSSVYQSIARQMAQQSPLSTSLRVENSAANPLTLANGFTASTPIARNTFTVDPSFRIGYSQNWQLSVQRDLPANLVVIATYLGIKGTRIQQQFLPNTTPIGGVNPCPACPSGFSYLTSNGNSIRHAAQIELRRRLRSGFTATLQYTFSKSIDNAATLGGQGSSSATQTTQDAATQASTSQGTTTETRPTIAQDWLNLRAERSLSNFNQRHLASALIQYTTGMGIGGGTLIGGWRGAFLKGWTLSTQINAGTGLPLTPIYFAAVPGTGVTGSIRPDYTGAPLYNAPDGFFLNPMAYAAPASGRWGNAGRNSITGPSQVTLNASMGRMFRVSDKLSLDMRVDATNTLNHPVFPSWNTTVNGAQFGLPNPANPMRSIQTTARLRF